MKVILGLLLQQARTSLLAVILAIAAVASAPACAEAVWQDNGVAVCTVTNAQESPDVVDVGSGATVIVWADTRDLDYDIYAQKLNAAGQTLWAPGGVMVCGAEYDQQFPMAVADGAGGAIVIWQDGRLGDDGLDIYAQRIGSDGVAAWAGDGVALCAHEVGMEDPPMAFSHVVTADGSGGAVVAWRDTRNDPIGGNAEIYAQKVNGSGMAGWAANGVKIVGFTTQKWSTRNPVIAPDGSGGAVVAWQDSRAAATTGTDLYIQRVTSAGATSWTVNGVAVCTLPGEQTYPDIIDCPDGAVVLTWEDKRSGNYDVYAQRYDASGVPQWGMNGRLICSSANDQRTPRVCPDGEGGTIIAWTDKRTSTAYTDIYAQRLDSAGSPLWQDQGTAVCTAAGSQTRVRMAPSVSGMTILTWMDNRSEAASAVYDIYGQMLESSGAPRWTSAGIPVGALTGTNQRMHRVSSDGAGSLCAVWEDDRAAGDWDIYGQKLAPWLQLSDIAEAISQVPGTPVALPPAVVTGSFDGCFYIEETDRTAGIRVVYADGYSPGTRAVVVGTAGTGPEPFICASLVTTDGRDDVPPALGMTPSKLGSGSVGEVPGLRSLGLLVRTWGTVISTPTTERPYIVISDGVKQVRVYSTQSVDVGDTIAVTGVCSAESTVSGAVVSILTRNTSDINSTTR